MPDKYYKESLPVTDKFLREKRLLQQRGELALISDGQVIQHLSYFSLNPGKGFARGNHYHQKKTEHFYVISGTVSIDLVDIETHEKKRLEVHTGDRLTIFPLLAHRFIAGIFSQLIEYYKDPFDPEDDISFTDF